MKELFINRLAEAYVLTIAYFVAYEAGRPWLTRQTQERIEQSEVQNGSDQIPSHFLRFACKWHAYPGVDQEGEGRG